MSDTEEELEEAEEEAETEFHEDTVDSEAIKRLEILAPWSEEVSIVLSDNSTNNWIQVCNHSGFNPLRWGSHLNPCLSFLAEFFKHNKSEATNLLLQTLYDLNREDAARIIESAETKNRSSDSAQIFISYQWDAQSSAQAIKYSLEKDGFRCWMDIGEVDGEEPLQQVIHQAIKGCQTVVLCLNSKYLESENCSTEVRLAHEWRKPIITLIMEPMRFPPEKNELGFLSDYPSIIFYLKDNQRINAFNWPPKSYENLKKKLQMALTKPKTHQMRANPKDNSKAFHVVVSCSPDKYFEMQNLMKRLKAYGYNCKVVKISNSQASGTLSNIDCEVIIGALSLRFMKSSVASNEIVLSSKLGRPIIPLLLDNISYPPDGQTKPVFSRLEPVDCSQMPLRSRDHWNTEETEEVLDRLESLIPDVQPIRLPRREKSNIPLAKDHVKSLAQPVPQDPLAREASEIRIQIRPPTPDKDGGSHIPIPKQRRRSNSLPGQESPVEEDSDPEDESDYPSTDSEVRTAKEMQRSYKLPQLHNNGRPQTIYQTKPTYTRNTAQKKPTYGRAPASKPPINSSSSQQKPPPRKQNFYNPDGPKLPSVYRKKFAVY